MSDILQDTIDDHYNEIISQKDARITELEKENTELKKALECSTALSLLTSQSIAELQKYRDRLEFLVKTGYYIIKYRDGYAVKESISLTISFEETVNDAIDNAMAKLKGGE